MSYESGLAGFSKQGCCKRCLKYTLVGLTDEFGEYKKKKKVVLASKTRCWCTNPVQGR